MPKIFSNGINATAEILTELGATYGANTLAELEEAIIADQKNRIISKRASAKLKEHNQARKALEETQRTELETIDAQSVDITK